MLKQPTARKFTIADNISFALDVVSHVIVWGVGVAFVMAIIGGAAWAIWTATHMAFGDYWFWPVVVWAIFGAALYRVLR